MLLSQTRLARTRHQAPSREAASEAIEAPGETQPPFGAPSPSRPPAHGTTAPIHPMRFLCEVYSYYNSFSHEYYTLLQHFRQFERPWRFIQPRPFPNPFLFNTFTGGPTAARTLRSL